MKLTKYQGTGICLWFLVTAGIGVGITYADSPLDNEQRMLMGLVLVAIGFPSTLAGCAILAGVGLLNWGQSELRPALDAIVGWAVLSGCGAIQWFILLPLLWGRIKYWFAIPKAPK